MNMVRRACEWAKANLTKTDPFRVERMTGFNEGKILIDGNTAAALGASSAACSCGLVSHHAGLQLADALNEYLPLRTDPETGKQPSPSFRPKTNWPRSAW